MNNDPTTFTCPACHRTMPSSNQLIHSARCTGFSPTSVPTAPTTERVIDSDVPMTSMAPIMPIVSDRREEGEDFWVCRLCSYHNTRTTRCTMCDTPIDTPPSQTHQNGGWSCQLCTYENPPSASECVMCSTSRPDDSHPSDPRPSDQVYTDRLIMEENDEPGWCRVLNENERRSGNGERQPLPIQNNEVSANTNAARGAVLGALGGAALAYLNNRSVSQGAIGGAALGALLSLSTSNERNDGMEGQNDGVQRNTTTTINANGSRTVYTTVYRPQVAASSPFRSRTHVDMNTSSSIFDEMERMLANVHQQHGSSFGFDGTDGLTYEDLLERFGNGNVQRSATEETINSLPTRTFTDTQRTSSSSSSADGRTCLICLEQFSEGTTVKTLPCLHQFCCGCVDTWLRQNASCPICKTAL